MNLKQELGIVRAHLSVAAFRNLRLHALSSTISPSHLYLNPGTATFFYMENTNMEEHYAHDLHSFWSLLLSLSFFFIYSTCLSEPEVNTIAKKKIS